MSEYLKLAENEMIHIIKEKYQDIQHEFISLDALQVDIKEVFGSIKKIRIINHEIQKKFREHLIRMYKLKKKQKAINKIIEIYQILKVILEASQAIDQLIETNNIDTAIEIIESTEKLIAERIASVNVAL